MLMTAPIPPKTRPALGYLRGRAAIVTGSTSAGRRRCRCDVERAWRSPLGRGIRPRSLSRTAAVDGLTNCAGLKNRPRSSPWADLFNFFLSCSRSGSRASDPTGSNGSLASINRGHCVHIRSAFPNGARNSDAECVRSRHSWAPQGRSGSPMS